MGTASTTTQNHGADPVSGPVLVLRLKKKTLARYALTSARLTLGRASDSDIVLDESNGVSRNHAHILIIDGEVLVEDLASRNGIFVNGNPVTRRTLRPGDRIAIGHYRLHFIAKTERTAQHATPENEITTLFRLWGPAAVTAEKFGCPLCHALVDSDVCQDMPESITGEYIQIDEECSNWFANQPDSATVMDVEKTSADCSDSASPGDSVVSTAEPIEDDDEMMARVERLVGLAPVQVEKTAHQPAVTHDSRTKLQARKTKPKRKSAIRSKPRRLSRLQR